MARPPLTTRRRKKVSAGARSKSVPEEVPVSSAYREYERELINAWRSEYQQQLLRLAAFVSTTKPRTQEDRRTLEAVIKALKNQLRGRPLGTRQLKPAAEHVAADLVRLRKQSWLENNNGRRVPASVTRKLIKEAVQQISFQWNLRSLSKIDANQVRRLLEKK